MPEFSDVQKVFNAPTQTLLKRAWQVVPEQQRTEIDSLLQGIPLNKNPLNSLIDLALMNSKAVLGTHKSVALIGPANVGKSTLFNQFVRAKTDQAEVSPIPGTTRVNQEADTGIFNMIDTPGADAVGAVGETEREHALAAARHADFLVLVFDALQGIKQTELGLYNELLGLKKPFIIVLNKIDLVEKFKKDIIAKTAANLDVSPEQVIAISALKGEGIGQVTLAIIAADPAMTLALAKAMPQYRRKIAWRSIATASSLSAAIALSPLPVIDFIPLVAAQTGMVLTIARIYQYKITAKRARELIGTFGLGMLGKLLFQQLSKFAAVPGWILSSAIATSMTIAMGYAAIEWFEQGERISNEKVHQLSRELSQSLVLRLREIFKRKPSKKQLKKVVADLVGEKETTTHPETETEN
ncbi:MAG: GTPase [Anaerolineaceae bacterium]|nr:GTPase [Anaerolineaceae bacterium]